MIYFYLDKETEVTFTVNKATSTNLQLSELDDEGLRVGSQVFSQQISSVSPIVKTIPKGFYFMHFFTSVAQTFTLSYQGDHFLCPYPEGYSDIDEAFPGCVFTLPSSDQPTNYHALNSLRAHSCEPRQWYKSGVGCFNVDSSCNGFDQHSGRCTSCDDPKVQPDNGKCSTSASTAVSCGPGLHQVGGSCIPEACAATDSNGQCSSCVSVLYSVVAGVCIEKSCPLGQTLNSQTGNCDAQCPGGKQLIGTTCYIIPSNCAGLTQALHCSGCVDPQKYKLVRGFCQPCTGSNPNFPCVSCPGSQIVSSSGGCISYNAFCSSVNSDNGQCSSFLSGYPPVNGFCCSSGSALSNGRCPSSTNPGQSGGSLSAEPGSGPRYVNCGFFSLILNRCTNCKQGYNFRGSTDECVLISS